MEQRNDKKEEKNENVSRRSFLKTAGVAGLAVGGIAAGGMSNPKSALAGEATGRPIVDLTIHELEKPPYMNYPYEDADKLERFDEGLTAFNNKNLSAEKFDGLPHGQYRYKNRISLLKQENHISGYSLLDFALSDSGWTSYRGARNLFSWEPIGVADLKAFDEVEKWNGTPEENNKIIKKAGKLFGSGQTGVTEVNEQWFYSKSSRGLPIIFSDKHEKPLIASDAQYIPKSMKTLIVMAIPMFEEHMKYAPSVMQAGATGTAYSQMAESASKMAEFIRGLGYNAIPMGNDTGLSVPMAIDAGLGELGRHGLLINPVYGSWLRICKVLTDLPVTFDKPIDFGAAKFCRSCMKCAETCPSKSISFDKDPSTKIYCESNNPGMKKWYVDTWGCLVFWTENAMSCATCQAVCPYNKPQTWIHDIVKGVSAVTPAFNGIFRQMDDLLAYGQTMDENDPWEWWEINK